MDPEQKVRETKSNDTDEFRPRICTYGGRELTPYRLRTTSQSDSSRHHRTRRITSISSNNSRIGAFSSTESLFGSYVPPKINTHHNRSVIYTAVNQNGVNRDSETGESDGMVDRRSKSTSLTSSTNSLRTEPFEAWKVLVTCTLTFVLIGINWVAFPLFYVEFTEHFQSSKSVLGWIGSLQNAGSQIIGLFVSAPVQMYGCRPVAFIGGIVLTIGTALSVFSTNIAFLYFSYGIISGIGLGMVNLSAMVIVQQHFNRNRTIATAIAMMGASIGQVVGPLVLEFLIINYGWRGAMLIYSAVMLHSVPFAISFTPVHSSSENSSNTSNKNHTDDKSIRVMMRKTFDFSLLKEVPFTLFCFSFFLVKFNVFGFYQHLPSRVVYNGMDKRTAALLMTLTGIMAAISRLAGGFLGNLACANRALMYAVAVTIAGADTILLAFSSVKIVVAVICGIFGACMGTTMLMVSVVLVDLLGVEKIARSHGLFNVFSGVAGLLATPYSGWLFDVTNNYDVPFLVVGIMGLIGGLVAFAVVILDCFMRRRKASASAMKG